MRLTRLLTKLREECVPLLTGAVFIATMVSMLAWFWPDAEPRPTQRFVQTITIVSPPPEPEPEPEKTPAPVIEKKIVETPKPIVPPEQKITEEAPSETPADAPAEPTRPAGLLRPADAGSDSFRLAAGHGGGLFGRGGGGSSDWAAAVAWHITRALQLDPGTRNAHGSVQVEVEIDAEGRFNAAQLLSSTGDPALDTAIRAVLSALTPMNRPRPPGVSGSTRLTIVLKRSDS